MIVLGGIALFRDVSDAPDGRAGAGPATTATAPAAPSEGQGLTASALAPPMPTSGDAPIPPGAPPAAVPESGFAPAVAPAAPAASPDGSASAPTSASLSVADGSTPPESQPTDNLHALSMPELRWCKFTEVRLMAIRAEVPFNKRPAFNDQARPWEETCRDVEVHRIDTARVGRELTATMPRWWFRDDGC